MLSSRQGQVGLAAAKQGIEKYQEFAQEHPRAAANIEAVTNIGLLAAPVKAKPSSAGLIGKAGRAVEKSGLKSSIKTKKALAADLVTPKQTAKVRKEQVPRTTEQGVLLKTSEVELTPLQKAGADEIVRMGISPRKTTQGNYNVIKNGVAKETDRLKAALAKTGARGKFNKQDYFDELDAALIRLQENPALVGNAEVSATRIINEMKKLVEDGKPHVSALLAARKTFDRRLLKEGRGKLLDPTIENAMSIALREVRQTTNNFIQKTVPTVGVRNSLKKQSSVLTAMDDIAVKAADEANSALRRSFRKALKVLTIRGELNQSAALLWGVGGMGAAFCNGVSSTSDVLSNTPCSVVLGTCSLLTFAVCFGVTRSAANALLVLMELFKPLFSTALPALPISPADDGFAFTGAANKPILVTASILAAALGCS